MIAPHRFHERGESLCRETSCGPPLYPNKPNNNNGVNDHVRAATSCFDHPRFAISGEHPTSPWSSYSRKDCTQGCFLPMGTTSSRQCCVSSPPSLHSSKSNLLYHCDQCSVSSPQQYHHYYNNNTNTENTNKKRCRQYEQDLPSESIHYKSDLLPNVSQKRKIIAAPAPILNISSTLETKYKPMEDSTLLFLMDMVCKVVEKKQVVYSPNLSSDMNSCNNSSNNSHCSSPTINSSPISVTIGDSQFNNSSNSSMKSTRKQHRMIGFKLNRQILKLFQNTRNH